MSAFAAIKKAEEFGKNYQQKFNMLSRSHMKGEYNDTPSMESGRYNSAGMRSDGRRRIQGYSTGQRYKAMADREARIKRDMDNLKFFNDPERSVIGKQGVGGATYAGPRAERG
jgi:hypothetical protein